MCLFFSSFFLKRKIDHPSNFPTFLVEAFCVQQSTDGAWARSQAQYEWNGVYLEWICKKEVRPDWFYFSRSSWYSSNFLRRKFVGSAYPLRYIDICKIIKKIKLLGKSDTGEFERKIMHKRKPDAKIDRVTKLDCERNVKILFKKMVWFNVLLVLILRVTIVCSSTRQQGDRWCLY